MNIAPLSISFAIGFALGIIIANYKKLREKYKRYKLQKLLENSVKINVKGKIEKR